MKMIATIVFGEDMRHPFSRNGFRRAKRLCSIYAREQHKVRKEKAHGQPRGLLIAGVD